MESTVEYVSSGETVGKRFHSRLCGNILFTVAVFPGKTLPKIRVTLTGEAGAVEAYVKLLRPEKGEWRVYPGFGAVAYAVYEAEATGATVVWVGKIYRELCGGT